LDLLLERNQVAGHELIQGELLIGDSGGRGETMQSYNYIHRLSAVPHEDVVFFVRGRGLHGRGIGWIDAHLLASALVANVPLWTADKRLGILAAKLGVGYASNTI
jgi:hypothetical protein